MIPKTIHYCWFGNKPLPKSAIKCINSWKKYFPEYEIKQWNEKNFDININDYVTEAYKSKKFAFVTDVARLYILYKYGGIYFDVDVKVIKAFDDILCNKAFFAIEKEGKINTGLGFGSEKNSKFVKELLNDYTKKHFILEDGKMDLTPCPEINSKIFKNYGFQLNNTIEKIDDIAVYPKDYFNPMEVGTGKINKTENTRSIHLYSKSWLPKKLLYRSIITRPFHIILGEDCFKNFKKK